MAHKQPINRVRITRDTFIGGNPVSVGTMVGNGCEVYATEQQMKDLILYGKAVEAKPEAERQPAGKAGK